MSFIYRYLSLHYKNLVDALTRITEQPLGNLMTIVVIGIALALPAGLRVMVSNISTMSDSWDAAADFTIYLEMTCLLYTSPSPRDGLLSRMPSSA